MVHINRFRRLVFPIAAVCVWLASWSAGSAAAGRGGSRQAASEAGHDTREQTITDAVADELLVEYQPGADESKRATVRAIASAKRVKAYRRLRIERLRLPSHADLQAAVVSLSAHPDVRAVQPNYVRRAARATLPDDRFFLDGSLWAMLRMGAVSAWQQFGPGASTVVVASIDTGINYEHPDLAANLWTNPGEIPGNGVDDDGNGYVDDVYGIDTADGDSDPLDDHWHGTHTAGTIGAVANNGAGVAGVSWNVRLMSCKFMNAAGIGTDAAAIECFDYVIDQRSRGVNVRVTADSWGAPRQGVAAPLLKSAIDAAGAAGILNVFAAGNSGTDNDAAPVDPASFSSPSIISVAASDEIADSRVFWSNFGPTSVDLAAPGVNIVSTCMSWYAAEDGTSMAAAHVAGAAALLFAHHPELSVSAAKAALLDNVDHLPQWAGLVASGGRVNIENALVSLAAALPVQPGPAPRSATAVPGRIEAENFDNGVSGSAYFDRTSGNSGGQYRDTDVDIAEAADLDGGYTVGWTAAGEWLNYTLAVDASGQYAVDARVASSGLGGLFHLEVNGVNRTGPIRIPDTGGWQQWQTITTIVPLEAWTKSAAPARLAT
jgi:serine protease